MKYTHEDYLKAGLSPNQVLNAYEAAFGNVTEPIKTLKIIKDVFEEFDNPFNGWDIFYAELDKYLDQIKADAAANNVNHPTHYGGEDNPYEAIKVIEAWDLGFNLGNVVKYLSRAGKKGDTLEDLRKAAWYLNREIQNRENE
jgi:hypothetical protein